MRVKKTKEKQSAEAMAIQQNPILPTQVRGRAFDRTQSAPHLTMAPPCISAD